MVQTECLCTKSCAAPTSRGYLWCHPQKKRHTFQHLIPTPQTLPVSSWLGMHSPTFPPYRCVYFQPFIWKESLVIIYFHLLVFIRTLFLFIAKSYYIGWIYHILFMYPSAAEVSGTFDNHRNAWGERELHLIFTWLYSDVSILTLLTHDCFMHTLVPFLTVSE